MARADGRHTEVGALQLQHGLRQRLDGRGRSLLHEQVALFAVRKGIEDEIDRVAERHHEAGHIGICDSQRLALADLIAEQRND